MKKIFLIAVLMRLFTPDTDVQAAFSSVPTQVTAGTGISVTGSGSPLAPYIITATSGTPTFNNTPTISLNSSSQISTTKNASVTYSVSVATTLSLLNLNSAGMAYLEISPNNSTWQEICRAGTSKTLSVAITIGLNETASLNLQGQVPSGYYRRIRSTGTVTYNSGQEVLY